MTGRRVLGAIALVAATHCDRHPTPPPALPSPRLDAAIAPLDAQPEASVLPVAVPDAGRPPALTVRVVNASAVPLTILTNEDTNEILHTRKLRDRRQPDASPATIDGELVKFFTVGQEPPCSVDGGAGYGGLGQPRPRTLAPGEAMEFAWDGQQRHEVLGARGVCVEVGDPVAGRYRFEFDQPYNMPQCTRPVLTWPLAADAPHTLEVRCVPRPHRPGEEN